MRAPTSGLGLIVALLVQTGCAPHARDANSRGGTALAGEPTNASGAPSNLVEGRDTDEGRKRVASLLASVVRVRHLDARTPVTSRSLDRDRLLAHMRMHV